MPISLFRRVSCYEGFSDIWYFDKEILGRPGVLPCLVPQWPQIMQRCMSFRCRSDLVLDADHSLDFSGTYLVLHCSKTLTPCSNLFWRFSPLERIMLEPCLHYLFWSCAFKEMCSSGGLRDEERHFANGLGVYKLLQSKRRKCRCICMYIHLEKQKRRNCQA